VRVNRHLLHVVLIAILAVGLVCTGVAASLAGSESRVTRASDELSALPKTRLTALPHSTIADGASTLRVRLSARPASFSPKPRLRPAVAGTWVTRGRSEIFTPRSGLEPCRSYMLVVSAASTSVGHAPLGRKRNIPLQVACPTTRGLQQTLARLDYLPYEARSARHSAGRDDRASLAAFDAFDPSPHALHARVHDAPPLTYGELDATTRGALMTFQSAHELAPTGEPSVATWKALYKANEHAQRDKDPYTFVTVTETIPETLEVHRGNHVALSTPVNTGVPGAETAQGIFPIVTRFESTTMVGTNPDGSKYSDPGVPWVNYFNGGDAVHGFPRGSYGTPQSNGCVELPIDTAETVYGMLQLGDIVEIEA
jgi:lipoprotein-anchoring transpeptidase ErfK/SrfK